MFENLMSVYLWRPPEANTSIDSRSSPQVSGTRVFSLPPGRRLKMVPFADWVVVFTTAGSCVLARSRIWVLAAMRGTIGVFKPPLKQVSPSGETGPSRQTRTILIQHHNRCLGSLLGPVTFSYHLRLGEPHPCCKERRYSANAVADIRIRLDECEADGTRSHHKPVEDIRLKRRNGAGGI